MSEDETCRRDVSTIQRDHLLTRRSLGRTLHPGAERQGLTFLPESRGEGAEDHPEPRLVGRHVLSPACECWVVRLPLRRSPEDGMRARVVCPEVALQEWERISMDETFR